MGRRDDTWLMHSYFFHKFRRN